MLTRGGRARRGLDAGASSASIAGAAWRVSTSTRPESDEGSGVIAGKGSRGAGGRSTAGAARVGIAGAGAADSTAGAAVTAAAGAGAGAATGGATIGTGGAT